MVTQEGFAANDMIAEEIAAYLRGIAEGLAIKPGETRLNEEPCGHLAEAVFSILTSKKFCYISRRKVERYRPDVVASLKSRMARNEPLRFFYDIGPGYHATIQPGIEPLGFDVGLSELLILYQVNSVCRSIGELYGPGSKFWLVVDNICALRTNDIPLEDTERYVRALRCLLDETGLSERVELVVESEVFDLKEYDRRLAATEPAAPLSTVSPEALENVCRFLGRKCGAKEAAERIQLYSRTGAVTDGLVNRFVRDAHMTQRATGATLGFRPFPGGDQRTQTGEVVLVRGSKGRLRPMLRTSRNAGLYRCHEFHFPNLLPSSIKSVKFAESVEDPPGVEVDGVKLD